MAKPQTHPHKLRRVNTAKKDQPPFYVYKCVHCRFFLQEKLCLGALVECWRCQKEFTMEVFNLRQARPRCRVCTGKEIPLGDMPPPSVDLSKLREGAKPAALSEEDADAMVDRILKMTPLGKVKR